MQTNSNKIIDFIKNHKFNEAIKSLDDLILNDSKNITYYNLRAICNLQLSKYEEAKRDFAIVVSSKPNFPEVYNNLGVLHFTIGQNDLAIKNFLKSIEIKKDFEKGIFGLIKTLSHTKKVNEIDSIFISKHKELNEIEFDYFKNEFIKNEDIKNLVKKINNIIKDSFINLKFYSTQIYRKSRSDLNCNRHKKVFNTYQAIPEFCFGCYKVQIEPENLIDLIKTYLIFDNIEFENNNTRKCMVETRPKINGHYKALIYCSSLEEAENLKKQIEKIFFKNLGKEVKINVKRGCTEYGAKYPQYKNLKENVMSYVTDWKKYESLIDDNFPDLIVDNNIKPTINGVTLNDAMTIQNWLKYGLLIGDETCKDIKSYFFNNEYLEKKIKLK